MIWTIADEMITGGGREAEDELKTVDKKSCKS
jgi:hypothetical protein